MDSFVIKESIQNLLDSDILTSEISEATRVNRSTISKLRSKAQDIDDTNFASIRRLYDFYLRNKKEVEAKKGVPDYVLSQKLPNRVQKFLEELAFGVNLIHQQETSRINKVYIYDEYTIDEVGNSKDKSSYIEINETIPISKHGEVYPYHIAIKNEIESRQSIDEIMDLKIVFNKEELEIALKKYKSNGAKIKTYKTSDGGMSLKVNSGMDNTEIYGIESEYFDIQYQIPDVKKNKRVDVRGAFDGISGVSTGFRLGDAVNGGQGSDS